MYMWQCGDVQAVALATSHFPALLQGEALGVTEIAAVAGQVAGDPARHLDSDRVWFFVVGVRTLTSVRPGWCSRTERSTTLFAPRNQAARVQVTPNSGGNSAPKCFLNSALEMLPVARARPARLAARQQQHGALQWSELWLLPRSKFGPQTTR